MVCSNIEDIIYEKKEGIFMRNIKEIGVRKLSELEVDIDECKMIYELYKKRDEPIKFEGLFAVGNERIKRSVFEVQVEKQCMNFCYTLENGVEYKFIFSVEDNLFEVKAYPDRDELRIGGEQYIKIIMVSIYDYNKLLMILKYADYMYMHGLVARDNPLASYRSAFERSCNNIEKVFGLCYSNGHIKKLELGKGRLRTYENGYVENEFVGNIDLNVEINSDSYLYGSTMRKFNEKVCSLDYKQFLQCKDAIVINAIIDGNVKHSVMISCDIKLLVDDVRKGIYIENIFANGNILFDSETDYEDALAYILIATRSTDYSQLIREEKEVDSKFETLTEDEIYIDSFKKLNNLVGLTTIKEDVKDLANFMKLQIMRQHKGLKTIPVSLHLVFSGNPGTGKTTIARILGDIYKNLGILSKGHLVEVDRSSLVAGYVGQTAIKTQEKINEAKGGILFIDEAYTLAKEGNDYGQEAIDTILKAMEDYRDDFVVIVAGYSDLMQKFINSNPGLKSRFNKYINFPDYSAEELISIFINMCKEYDFILSDNAIEVMKEKIITMEKNKDVNFANARDIRNLFEKVVTQQATRLFEEQDKDIMRIEAVDFK